MILLQFFFLLLTCYTTTTSNALQQPRQQAIVVGSGPVGIAASLILANNHNYDVTLLESSPASSTQTAYDPTKAFLYNVNERGQRLTKMFPSMHQRMVERSVVSKGFGGTTLTVVPADPTLPIPEKKMNVPAAAEAADKDDTNEDDSTNQRSMPSGEKAGNVGFWIPRHEMVKLMVEEIDEHNQKGVGGTIKLCTGMECVSVTPRSGSSSNNESDKTVVVVTAQDTTKSTKTTTEYTANLVIGADGMNSQVRTSLANAEPGTWSSNCIQSSKFQPKKYTSPASYLRIKVLQFPPQFEIPNAKGKPNLTTFSEDIYALRSIKTGPRSYLSLGLLPMKDNTAVRPTNIITRPDHEVWKITDGDTMRKYFQEAFPRLNFAQEGGMISNEEWERFAKAEGTRFPPCQYSPGLAVWDKESGSSGVALCGDAIHAFSPDIGQGVNSGLMDVVCLDRALSGLDVESGKEITTKEKQSSSSSSSSSLATNLERYQKQHAPEIASLIRLARFGAPYQYRQPHRADRALRLLWTANVIMRLLLNKVTFGLIQPPCIILSQNAELTFKQVMTRADRSTALIKTVLLAGVWLWAKKRFGLALFQALP
jgi:kynurenine 3-monooxygenase